MYKDHPSFKAIQDDSKIWRFMDLAKFCALLEKKSLFFARPESFDDPWEGCMPKAHYDEANYVGLPQESRKQMVELEKGVLHLSAKQEVAVNCWHINDDESEFLWKNYSNRGILIQSTFKRLKNSFNLESDYNVYIGKIAYKDPEKDTVDLGNFFNRTLWKRKSFQHEQELRAVIWEKENRNGDGKKSFDHENGHKVKVDLEELVENSYTSPFEQDDWFHEVVNDLITTYGCNFPLKKSELMTPPF